MSLCFKSFFLFFFLLALNHLLETPGSFSGRSSPGLMETREVESFGRPAGINIPLTSCSGATCCHSSSSFSSLFLLSTTAAAAAAAFFIYLHPSHSLLPSDHRFISSHRRKSPPPSLPSSTSCLFPSAISFFPFLHMSQHQCLRSAPDGISRRTASTTNIS